MIKIQSVQTWRRKVKVLLLALLGFSMTSMAQSNKSASIWYFGDKAGIDFSSGTATPLLNSTMTSFQGSAVQADAEGQLLFYTNGGSLPYAGGVWNRNHQLMPNGDMESAGGCNSSLQSSLILQQPRQSNQHYLFTTDCAENNYAGGLRYTVIDMNMDGGLGDVTQKGLPLMEQSGEALTAIQHANGKDYWLVAHKVASDSFFVFPLSDAGIGKVSVQKIGEATPTGEATLQASPQGNKVVICANESTTLFSFDNKTGEFSAPKNLQTKGHTAAFSADGNLLYIGTGEGKEIYQINLQEADLKKAKTLVGLTTSASVGAMQLAPDGKIYVARAMNSGFLGVIEDPSVKGTDCDYRDNGFHLAGQYSKAGLPNFPNNAVIR